MMKSRWRLQRAYELISGGRRNPPNTAQFIADAIQWLARQGTVDVTWIKSDEVWFVSTGCPSAVENANLAFALAESVLEWFWMRERTSVV